MPRAKPINTSSIITNSCSNSWNPRHKTISQSEVPSLPASQRVWKFLNLCTESVGDVNISTFRNLLTLSKSINRLLLVAKINSHENIFIKALCFRILCLPISSPSITFLKRQFKYFRGIESVDADSEKEIDLMIGSDLYWIFVMGTILWSLWNWQVWLQLRLSLDGF